MNILMLALLLQAPTPTPHCPDPSLRNYDVIVVGAGSSGVAAAIQATVQGATVALIEEGNVIGGQIVAAGVTTMDGGGAPPVLSGIYEEYRDRVHDYYDNLPPAGGYTASTCYGDPNSTCSEPHISEQILWEMLEELPPDGSTLCPFLNKKVLTVQKTNNVVTGLTTGFSFSDIWTAHVVIDATEYGDVIPLAGARYRIGKRKSDGAPDPNNCIQDITYTAVVRKYNAIWDHLQVPSFAGYDQAEGEFLNFIGLDSNGPNLCPNPWFDWEYFKNYRGMPDSLQPPPSPPPPNFSSNTRTGANTETHDYPGWFYTCTDNADPWWTFHLRGKLSEEFLLNPTKRVEHTCKAKALTIHFLRYMQRPTQGQPYWAIADEEYVSPTGNCTPYVPASVQLFERLMPPMPYVRESRRIMSADPLTGLDIRRTLVNGTPTMPPNAPGSLAMGEYPTDMHNCKDPGDLENAPGDNIQEIPDHKSTAYGPFQIPFSAFMPEVVDGFLPAEKNLGYSRMASAAARMQPSTMRVGQAAGAIAALAAERSQQPRAVRVLDVQKELLSAGAALARETFVDAPSGHARWPDAQLMATYEIMAGFTAQPTHGVFAFRIGDSVGRAEAAGALVKAFRITSFFPNPSTPTFQDVPTNHPQFSEVELMVSKGFDMSGCHLGPNFFCPGFALTRPQLARWLAHARWGTNLPPAGSQLYVDVPPTHPDYLVIQAVGNAGLMFACTDVGSPLFCPNTSALRGELARSLTQVLYTDPVLWP